MDEEEQVPEMRTTPYQSPMYNFGSSIILMTNPNDELRNMELTFRGLMPDEEGNLLPSGPPLINEVGIVTVIGMTRSIVNKITIMGNLNKLEISNMMDFAGDTLAKVLMQKYKVFKIHPSDRDVIYFTVLSNVFMCMKRGYEEGDRRFWKGSQQEITTKYVGGPNQRRGLLERVMGWAK